MHLIGAGGMGEVYLAHDEQLGRTVAVKVLQPRVASDAQRMRRFAQEARAVSALNHPNILTIFEVGQVKSAPFIATEFVDGETLRHRIETGKRPLNEILDIAVQIGSALDAAHAAGIVHRDIKPENIMLRRDGYVKVLDFGVAKLTDRSSGNAEASTLLNTEPGVLLGTASYMSPEQARGLTVDARTDIWSLGVVIYEMATGRSPFAAGTASDALVAILQEEPLKVSQEIPPELAGIIRKCLEKDKNLRYQSAGQLVEELKQLRRELESGYSTQRTQLMTKTPALHLNRKALFAIGAIALLIGLSATYFIRERSRRLAEEAAVERITLAVLPFRPLNADQEIGFLGIGIPDAIITRLANLQQIRLRPTNAILRYQNQDVNVQEVGKELASQFLVTGTLQKTGDSLRVSVQLLRVSDSSPLWGDHYDRPRSDLLNVQDSIAEKIATALRVKMSAAEQSRVYRRYTQNSAAYEAYLRGRSQLAHSTAEETAASVKSFEEALSLDSNYTLARSGLAMACAEMHLYFAPAGEVDEWGRRAKQEAQTALSQDANLAETHQALAAVYGKTEFDWPRTISESQQALELNPSLEFPHYLRARAFYHLGLFDAGNADVREGLEINPHAYSKSENEYEALRTKGITAMLSGQFSEGVADLEEAHRLSAGPVSDWWLAQAYYYQGQKERAERLLEELQHSPSASAAARATAILSSFLAARGERSRANELIKAVESGAYMDHHVAYSLGVAYAQLGQPQQAVAWLRKSTDNGFPCYPWYERDPLLDPLRHDAGFERFMAELKSNFETAKARYVNQ